MNDHNHNRSGKRNLLIATGLNLIISIAEIIGGVVSGSLALLSDAFHNLGDAFSTFIAWLASVIAERKSTVSKTFGYKRVEILAAVFNSMMLIGITIFLFIEAVERIRNPQEINSSPMLIVAVIGLIANIIAVIILHRDAGTSLNIKAAYLHLIGDSLSSLVVIIGGVLIYFFGLYWIDPVITFFIGVYILYEAVKILMEAIGILMQYTPSGLDIHKIKQLVEKDTRIRNIHHIHAWSLTDQSIYFEAHVDTLNDLPLSEVNTLREDLEQLLRSHFNVDHTTLQFEYKVAHDNMIENKD